MSVLSWIATLMRPVAEVQPPPVREAPPPRPGRAMAGPYVHLYQYLHKRFANTVVLTFGEIEDLLGFPLPDLARRQREWWTDVVVSSQSDAWTLASRSALPNLLAQTVIFDRASS